MDFCSVDGCENQKKCRGFCNKHHLKWMKYGDPNEGVTKGRRGEGFVHSSGYRMTSNKFDHRKIAEEKIGRPLTNKEVVHHIDGDIQNNHPDNLMVFPSQSEHAAHHEQLKREKRRTP